MAGDANMTIQAILIVSGDVQSVGYREYVYRQAVRLGLTGLVRNIDEKNVWIVCEGEPDKIEEFIRDIKVNDALAKVDNIAPRYGEARGCYDTFLVTRDLRFNGLPEAKLELGVEYLTKLLNSVDGIKESINHLDSHLTGGFNEVSSSIQKMDGHLSSDIKSMDSHLENMDLNMGQRFDRLDRKYGEFGKSMKGVASDMRSLAADMRMMNETSTSTASDIKDVKGSMSGMASDIKDVKGSMSGMASDIHAIRLAAVPPRKRTRTQILRPSRSRS